MSTTKQKAGYLTTEFWLSVLTIIAGSVLLGVDKIDAGLWVTVIGVSTGGYNLSRGLAKIHPPKD